MYNPVIMAELAKSYKYDREKEVKTIALLKKAEKIGSRLPVRHLWNIGDYFITTSLSVAILALLFVGSSLLTVSTAQAAEPDQTVVQLTHKVIGPATPCSHNSAFLAANPELKTICNYAAVDKTIVETAGYTGLEAFYAAKSDAARINKINAARYTGMAAFYAENPELMAANRYVAAETKLQRTFEADAARYTGMAAFYAENPELMAASRYTAQVE